jgi:hypothetical protein
VAIVTEQNDLMTQGLPLHEVLLAYLRAADAPRWPGTDSVTVEDVLRSYPQSAADGLVPSLPTLLERHPELAEALHDFFNAEAARHTDER